MACVLSMSAVRTHVIVDVQTFNVPSSSLSRNLCRRPSLSRRTWRHIFFQRFFTMVALIWLPREYIPAARRNAVPAIVALRGVVAIANPPCSPETKLLILESDRAKLLLLSAIFSSDSLTQLRLFVSILTLKWVRLRYRRYPASNLFASVYIFVFFLELKQGNAARFFVAIHWFINPSL